MMWIGRRNSILNPHGCSCLCVKTVSSLYDVLSWVRDVAGLLRSVLQGEPCVIYDVVFNPETLENTDYTYMQVQQVCPSVHRSTD